jgi:hypothetical protein
MGNTLEKQIVLTLGTIERGSPSDGPHDRLTGTGYVAASTDHDYADALSKKRRVTLLVTESTGALSASFAKALRTLGKQSREPGVRDSTIDLYGTARSSPRGFSAHHMAAISSAIVMADATVILNQAAYLSFSLSAGIGVRGGG